MTITYSLWQGSRLLSIGNVATNTKEIDNLIKELNTSDLAKSQKRLEIFTGKKPVQLELPLDNPNITEGNENE